MNLGVRLGLVYFVVTAILVGAVISAGITLSAIARQAKHLITKDAAMQQRLLELKTTLADGTQAVRLAAAGGAEREKGRQLMEHASALLNEIRRNSLPEEQSEIESLAASWETASNELQSVDINPKFAATIFNQGPLLPALTAIGQSLNVLENIRRDSSLKRIRRIRDSVRAAWFRMALFVLLLFIAAADLVMLIRRRFLSPILRMRAAADLYAQGRLSHRIDIEDRDEIGDLAEHINTMAVKLEAAGKSKMEFLSMISHDMKTPLTLINLYAPRLVDPQLVSNPEKRQKALDIILTETKQLQHLIEDLLEVARAEIGVFKIDPVVTETRDALTPLLTPFERHAEGKNIVFTHDLAGLPTAVLDGKRLGQALRNLLTNAFKFTAPGGKITVRGYQSDNTLVFEVTDNGSGIPPEDIPHIFTRFYQSPQSHSRSEREGVGLGLAIVREISRAHGGDIETFSEVGKGTTFRLWIPFRPPTIPQRSEE